MTIAPTIQSTRSGLVAMLVTGSLALSLAACGDDVDDAAAPLDSIPTPGSESSPAAPDTTNPGTTAPGFEHPVGADQVVLRIGTQGGFVPAEVAFLTLPTLLVTGDGRLIVQGPVPAIYPGPLLPNLQVRTISEAGIQRLLALAAEHGLLAQREYTNPTNIADAPDTVVEITVGGETYRHVAYALGFEPETDELRRALAEFVADATGAWMYGDNPELGLEEAYTSDTFLVRAMPVNDTSGYEVEPTIVEWPPGLPALAGAADCMEVSSVDVAKQFGDASQLTFFTSDGVTYALAVKPLLPGDSC